jgi:hypothetical protein
MGGIWPYNPIMAYISRDPPWDIDELMARAEKFINGEETVRAFTE